MSSKFRILIVDDEEDVRAIERMALSTLYEVAEASDGLDALERLDRVEPDFVVLDVMMPLMDGYETCRAMRNNAKYREIPVLFLSARRSTQAIKEGYGAGADLYLTKPFEPERLARNIEQYLLESRAKPRPKRHSIEALKSAMSKPSGLSSAASSRGASARPSQATPTPVSATPPPAAAPDEATAKPAGRSRPRVMVVDDEKNVLDLLSLALGTEFEVTTAENGIEAVEKIVLYQPDLIVLDAMLPKMSGYQLCASLRRNQSFGRTPIVFISAKSSPRDQEYCRRLGANDFLAKPFDPQELRQRLLAFVAAPDFVIRPKKLTLEQITVREGSNRWVKERSRDEERRRDPSGPNPRDVSP